MKIKNTFIFISGTLMHKLWVFLYMSKFAWRIFFRGIIHDNSKFTLSEANGYIQVIDKLKNTTYGTEEYKSYLRQIKPSVDLHYKKNPHHAEYYGDFNKMNLYDLVEMVSDWKAAAKRHKDGDIERSFAINKDRYKMSDEVIRLLRTI